MRSNALTAESLKRIAEELNSLRQQGVAVPIEEPELERIIRKAEIRETIRGLMDISPETPRPIVEKILGKVDELRKQGLTEKDLGSSIEKIQALKGSLPRRTSSLTAVTSKPRVLIGAKQNPSAAST